MISVCTRRSVMRFIAAVALSGLIGVPVAIAANPVPDFCFLQISDNHIGPYPAGSSGPGPRDRSVEELAWFCEEAKKPQVIQPAGLTTSPPVFVIATGDLTEYGVIAKTWDSFEDMLKPLGLPVFVVAGNHDNTWTSMLHILRRRHSGDHYSFDKFGCHFAAIDTATPQEPVPSIEQRTLTWLEADLKNVPRGTPIFLLGHHPLSSPEFAKPYEQLRLLKAIEGHNVVLYLMGHGHSARHERWNSLDSVMGGTTSLPAGNIGYSIISVTDGVLRVAYRFREAGKPMTMLIEKPLRPAAWPAVEFLRPSATSMQNGFSGDLLPIHVKVSGGAAKKVRAGFDDSNDHRAELMSGSGTGADGSQFGGRLPTNGLAAGKHYLWVKADFPAGPIDKATEILFLPKDAGVSVAEHRLEAGMKAPPLLIGSDAIVATTAGKIARISFNGPQPTSTAIYEAGVEILHAPAISDDVLYVSAAEKGVHAVNLAGKLVWQCDVGAVVYGTPAVTADRVYVGDLEGNAHAIDRTTGKLAWSKHHADFSIEQPIVHHDGVLYFGAWDGFVYAVSVADGSLKWKQAGPAGQTGETKYKSRYYGPADCPPAVVGDRLFVTDRAYFLGSYSLDGKYHGKIAEGVAAVGATEDGKGIYARGLNRGLTRYDGQGNSVWFEPVPLGRFPAPPVDVGGKVYVCANLGMLTVHSAADGRELLRYQVTPQLHVMAPVAVDADGNAYVTAMDGTITRVAPNAG